MVNASRVDAQGDYPSLFNKEASRLSSVTWKVQVGRITQCFVAQVPLRLWPPITLTGTEEHDRPGRNRAVFDFPSSHIIHGESIIRFKRRRLTDIDNHSRSDEPVKRHFTQRHAGLCEMDGSVDMRAAVLGSAEHVARVKVSASRQPPDRMRAQ